MKTSADVIELLKMVAEKDDPKEELHDFIERNRDVVDKETAKQFSQLYDVIADIYYTAKRKGKKAGKKAMLKLVISSVSRNTSHLK